MSKDDKIKSIQIETAETLLRYLTDITNKDLALSEEQARAVAKITLAIKAILRDL